jgi:predicted ATP-binding protein involved in virulence
MVDEIEAHLHPAWQRDIPSWLKTHFPSVVTGKNRGLKKATT